MRNVGDSGPVREDSRDTSGRRATILEAATQLFLRYGFKKTSMEDLARAAGLSRPGLYLHFATKEALFKAAVLHLVERTRAAALLPLEDLSAELEPRLVLAFEAIHGLAIGQERAAHLSELMETAERLVGPVIAEMEQGFAAELARALRRAGVAEHWKALGVSAKDLAEHLAAVSTGLKHRVQTRAEYREQLKVALRLVCRGRGD